MSSVNRHKFGSKKKVKNNKVQKKTRKELRKEQRLEKKAKKALYFQNKKHIPGKFVLNPDRINESKQKVEEGEKEKIKKSEENVNDRIKDCDESQNITKKKRKRKNTISQSSEKHRKMHLEEDNLKEDKMIKQLEKRLKLNKRKNKTTPKSFVNDGLDYLLDFCDTQNRNYMVEMEEQLLQNNMDTEFKTDIKMLLEDNEEECEENLDDFHDDFKKKKLIEYKKPKSNSESEINSENDSDSDNETYSTESNNEGKNNVCGKNKEKEDTNLSDQMQIDNVDQSDDQNLWEDIYGRTRDKHGNVVTDTNKYCPPAARTKILNSTSLENEKYSRLKKQLKGLINRVAENNMFVIANQIEELYMSNSRNDMNTVLSKLIMEALISPVLTPDRLICEHMMLITILHANIDTEIGAHFLLTFVKKFNEMLKESQDVENKELDNLILMISHLYNFKVYGHQLLYQILETLTIKFQEKEIEVILLILKTVGFQLRKDDPLALKELIINLQQKASSTESGNSRVKFMLDVLLAIKNNNVSAIPQYDPSHIEHLKKLMKSFIRKGNSVTRLNISLEDLLQANERGKWWIIGSAYSEKKSDDKQTKTVENNKLIFSQNLLELAKKQRMNTDTRRNIFCILMSAEDYMDAFEKLYQFDIKGQREKEIIYVLIDCCLQEKKFNLYYAVLAQKFCESDRKYQITMQYILWDKFKMLDNYGTQQIKNLARFLSHLFVEKSLPISILKVIEFAELDKKTVQLVRQIILGILLHNNEEDCMQVFKRISMSPKLQIFRESLRLFINHFLIKNISSCSVLETEITLIKNRVQQIDKILITRESRMIF